jgi:hypothetical protein
VLVTWSYHVEPHSIFPPVNHLARIIREGDYKRQRVMQVGCECRLLRPVERKNQRIVRFRDPDSPICKMERQRCCDVAGVDFGSVRNCEEGLAAGRAERQSYLSESR